METKSIFFKNVKVHAYAGAYVSVRSSADKPNKASYLFSVYVDAYACTYYRWMG